MTIDDIIRFFSGAADGQRMASDQPTAQTPMTQAMDAGAGRGFVNPPQGRPAPMQSVQPAQPVQAPQTALQPLPVTEIPNLPPVSAAMAQESGAPSAASMAPDNRDIGGGQNFAMQGPAPMQAASSQSKGILGYLDDAVGYSKPDFIGRLGTALAVAGSQDPTKALMMVQQQRGEEAKIAEARRRANVPKVDPIAGTPFFQITYPDGRMEMVNNPALAKFYQEQSANKAANKRSDMELQADLNAKALDNKAGVTAANAAIPEIKSANALLESIKTGRETLSRMGTADQIKGLAGGAGDIVAGFAAPQMNIDSQRREAVRVLDWVNSSAGLKGALSNVEGLKLDMPLPKPTASKEEWQAYFDNAEKIVNSALTHFQTQAARSPAAASSVGVSATPAPAASGGVSAPASKADFDKLPSGTRFRAPDGSIRIKP